MQEFMSWVPQIFAVPLAGFILGMWWLRRRARKGLASRDAGARCDHGVLKNRELKCAACLKEFVDQAEKERNTRALADLCSGVERPDIPRPPDAEDGVAVYSPETFRVCLTCGFERPASWHWFHSHGGEIADYRSVERHKPAGPFRQPMPSPTDADLKDPVFEAIWQVTKTWDVNAPEYYAGYSGMNGSHVKLILDAVREAVYPPDPWVLKVHPATASTPVGRKIHVFGPNAKTEMENQWPEACEQFLAARIQEPEENGESERLLLERNQRFKKGQWVRSRDLGLAKIVYEMGPRFGTKTWWLVDAPLPIAGPHNPIVHDNWLEPAFPRAGEWWDWTHEVACDKCVRDFSAPTLSFVTRPWKLDCDAPHLEKQVARGCLVPVNFGKG